MRVPAALGRVLKGLRVPDLGVEKDLGRALGHFIFSLLGLRGSYLLVCFTSFKSPT